MHLPIGSFDYNNTRICSGHKISKLEKVMHINQMVRNKIIQQKIKLTYEVPESSGVKSTLYKYKQELKRKHTARERRQISEWRQSYDNIKKTAGK